MNTPVVNIEELDTGPARAAILLCANECAGLDLMVCVRSITTGESVVFQYQGDPTEFGTPSHAIEAAMSFAEGIGFIFDDELIARDGAAGRRRARKIWTSMIDEPAAQAAFEEPQQPIDGEIPELPLTDFVDLEEDAGGDLILEDEVAPEAFGDDPGGLDSSPLATPDSGETVAIVEEPVQTPRQEAAQPALSRFRMSPADASPRASATQGRLDANVMDVEDEIDEVALDQALDMAVFEGLEGEEIEFDDSQPPGSPKPRDPSQSARFAEVALASESLGSELCDGTDFLTRALSAF